MEPGSVSSAAFVGYVGYRLGDAVFWAFPLMAVLTCSIHAARRAFRHPAPSGEGEGAGAAKSGEVSIQNVHSDQPQRRVILRYTLPQRVFHWANAFACIGLLVSGLAMYSPTLFAGAHPAAFWFALHRWLAIALMVGIPFHVAYDAYIRDSLGFMWFGRDVGRTLVQIIGNFLCLSPVYPKYAKYHPMQMGSHWMMAANLFALILTGLILWRPTRILLPLDLLGSNWGLVFHCRTLHDLFAGTFMALIIGHVYFALVIKKNWIISKTMLTGRIDYDYYARFHQISDEIIVGDGPRG